MSVSILIVGSTGEEDGVSTRLAGRALLWGLEQRGIGWDVYQPRTGPVPDLSVYDAILCWSHRIYRTDDYFFGAQEIEAQAHALGKPVINSVQRSRSRHSDFLTTWHEHGIPCARCQHFDDFEDIRMDAPMLLRRDGLHQGKDLFFAPTLREARQTIQTRQADSTKENLDLAVEFIDVRDEQGRYNKYRSLVIGERLIPYHVLVSDHWLVNYHGSFHADETAMRCGEAFVREGELNVAEVLAAARWTGADILALDYAKRPDGRYVFWEANRHFLMLEDYGENQSDEYAKATGHTGDGRDKMLEAFGLALGELVHDRATAERSPMRRQTIESTSCS